MNVLEVERLNVEVAVAHDGPPTRIVRDASFSLAPGQRLGLIGESGCGKTTTLLAIAGLLSASATVGGRVSIAGVDQFSGIAGGRIPALARRDVGVVFQGTMNALNPVQRIGAQLREGLRAEVRADAQLARARVDDLLERVGLSPTLARAYPHELSGGMRQRACIAIALAGEPRLLLADEPTTALDTLVEQRIVALLDELCRELQLAVVLVSHDLGLAAHFCDEIAVMYGGRIVERGAAAEVTGAPHHPYTALLLAATPTMTSTKGQIVSIPGAPPDLRDLGSGCAFAPRCPRAADVCAARPELRELDAVQVACHRAVSR
ncbi:MAG: ABC transporter ATP-binding protein [Actinobacteria bacterium]|nr:ABC transporter ATP-binding protein [Actinomycetota bacterium]